MPEVSAAKQYEMGSIADLFTKAIVEYQRFDMLRRACGMIESE